MNSRKTCSTFVSMSLLALVAGCGEDTASDTQGAGGSAPQLDANVGGEVLCRVY